MKIAAIDMGTNSFLCLIASVNGKTLQVIEDHAKVVRLGEKVHETKMFQPQALQRAKECLTEFRKIIDKNKVDKIIATATSAARDAQNGFELQKICDDLKIPLYIIEGKKEAELSFLGAVSALPDYQKRKVLVVDVGGGSTEIIFKTPGHEIYGQSFNVGCVRLTEMFLKSDPIKESEIKDLKSYARKTLWDYKPVNPEIIIAVAGTPTTLACVDQKIDFNEDKVEGFILTKDKIKKLQDELSKLKIEDRKKLKGLDEKRADVIYAGAVLLDLTLDLCNAKEMKVSTRGLRYGVALQNERFP